MLYLFSVYYFSGDPIPFFPLVGVSPPSSLINSGRCDTHQGQNNLTLSFLNIYAFIVRLPQKNLPLPPKDAGRPSIVFLLFAKNVGHPSFVFSLSVKNGGHLSFVFFTFCEKWRSSLRLFFYFFAKNAGHPSFVFSLSVKNAGRPPIVFLLFAKVVGHSHPQRRKIN